MKRTPRIDRESLEHRLRRDANAHRRAPSRTLHARVMAAVHGSTRDATQPVIARPNFTLRRFVAAAAVVLIVLTATLVLRNEAPQGGDSALIANGAPGDAAEVAPALVQPLLELAPRFAVDSQSPWDAEVNRMLADARHASHILLEGLPFRGRAETSERRDF